ncbi:MAG: LemA family protein [Hyphomicrobiaceae bacterium]
MLGVLTVPFLVMAAIGAIGLFAFNRLATLRRRCDQAYADIDVQLRHRHDVLPALVETVRSFTGHESEMLQGLVKARAAAMQSQSLDHKMAAEAALTTSIVALMAVSMPIPSCARRVTLRTSDARSSTSTTRLLPRAGS